jgi:hypothetical protein
VDAVPDRYQDSEHTIGERAQSLGGSLCRARSHHFLRIAGPAPAKSAYGAITSYQCVLVADIWGPPSNLDSWCANSTHDIGGASLVAIAGT